MTTTAPAAAAPGRVRPLRRAPALAAGLVVGLVLLAVLAVASVGVGARQMAPLDAWHALTAFDPTSFDHAAVRSRVPRTVVALVVAPPRCSLTRVLASLLRSWSMRMATRPSTDSPWMVSP